MEGSLALRALQLKAYAAAIDALRVSDPLSPNALQLVESLKKTFKISEVSFHFVNLIYLFIAAALRRSSSSMLRPTTPRSREASPWT